MLIPRRVPIVVALIAAGVAFMGLTLSASAAPNTIIQYPGGTCTGTLQACINAANPGDEIHIQPGLYITLVVLGKSVSLLGTPGDPSDVVIQAPPAQRPLTIIGTVTPTAEVAFITFQGGALAVGNGGGVLVLAGAQPRLHDLVIQNNAVGAPNAHGGGMFLQSSLALTNVVFSENTAAGGSGGGLAGAPSSVVTLSNVDFVGNEATDNGGGLFADSATVSGSDFSGNEANSGEGGGAYVTTTVSIAGGDWFSNTAQGHGGALYVGGAASFTDVVIQHNTSVAGRGGGAYVLGSVNATGVDFASNDSFDSGAGLAVAGPLTLTNSLIRFNDSSDGAGAGVRASSTAVISGTQFIGNTALNAGGGLRVNLHVVLTNTDFISNTSNASSGGLRAEATASIHGGSFVGNTSADSGGGALIEGDASIVEAVFNGNTILVGNGGGLAALAQLTVRSSLFTANRVLSGTAGDFTGGGGGLFADGQATLSGNRFIANFAFRLGGGADVDAAVSAGDEFRGNVTGPQGSGGGMFVAGVFQVNAALFFTNTANTGGGLGVNSNATGSIANSLFARNVVTFTDGGAAMRLLSTQSVLITHTTIVGTNQANRAAVHIQSSGLFTFTNNIFTDHAVGIRNFGPLTATEDYNLYFTVPLTSSGPVTAGTHSFIADPRFVNSAAGNYRLRSDSPAIDAGLFQGLTLDYEGDLRGQPAGFDLGFDEYVARLYLPLILR